MIAFDEQDPVLAPYRVPWELPTANYVHHHEGHNFPKKQHSLDEIVPKLNEITSRYWVAFDFDGVLCDSAKETAVTAFMAGKDIFPESDGKKWPSSELIEDFKKVRPLLESGFEALVLIYRLVCLNETPEQMLSSSTPLQDMESALTKMKVTKDELKHRFQITREAWIAEDCEGWLQENQFYQATLAALKNLISKGISVYIITTKHSSFANNLLRNNGVELDQGRIFGLGSGKKGEVLAKLAKETEAKLGGECIFIEDRLETLNEVNETVNMPIDLVLAGYGYNTAIERENARKQGFQVFKTDEDLSRWLDELSQQ